MVPKSFIGVQFVPLGMKYLTENGYLPYAATVVVVNGNHYGAISAHKEGEHEMYYLLFGEQRCSSEHDCSLSAQVALVQQHELDDEAGGRTIPLDLKDRKMCIKS
jgi:hypothetical protein